MSYPIVFVDTVCPKPYDPSNVREGGFGGTEAQVCLIAEALGKSRMTWVLQHNRVEADSTHSALYKRLSPYLLDPTFKAHTLIVLRNPDVAINLKRLHPDTPVWVWCHDLAQLSWAKYGRILKELDIGVIAVSDYHKTGIIDMMRMDKTLVQAPRVRRIYNAISDLLLPDATPIDNNKLMFLSSPHKGLKYTLQAFQAARRFNDKFKLYVSNPGYLLTSGIPDSGIVDLGVMAHDKVIEHLRSALCVFYPNHEFPETFGMVFAEANAVGTPVLTHALGASTEVLEGREQIADCKNLPNLIGKLMKWYKYRPEVKVQDQFRFANVIKVWQDVLKLGGNDE